MSIEFFYEYEQYGCFSNYSAHSFTLDGERWQTSEHYFQAMKFENPVDRSAVRDAPTPGDAKARAWETHRTRRPDWDKVKDDIMRCALLAKFVQNDDIRAVLVGTDKEMLYENAKNDSYWGLGPDRSGKNRLGFLLMELRELLSR